MFKRLLKFFGFKDKSCMPLQALVRKTKKEIVGPAVQYGVNDLTTKFNNLINAIGDLGWNISVPQTKEIEGLIIGTNAFIDRILTEKIEKVEQHFCAERTTKKTEPIKKGKKREPKAKNR